MGNYAIATAKPAAPDDNLLIAESLWRDATLCIQKVAYEKAGKYLTEALALVPEHPGCLASLALCLAEGQHKYLTAEKLARRAIRIAPHCAQGYHAIGRIYMLGGKQAQARDNLRRARRLAPQDRRIRIDLKELELQRLRAVQAKLSRGSVISSVKRVRNFLIRDRHLVLMTCLMLTTAVWISLAWYGRNVLDRELTLAELESHRTHQAFAHVFQ